jgi:Na+/phosphate symporter
MLLSMKGLSFTSMVFMILMNPQNALKISFSHFAFNISMALIAYIFPGYVLSIVSSQNL